MGLTVEYFSIQIGKNTYALDTGDIQIGTAQTKDIPKNLGTRIATIPLKQDQVTFTIKGINTADMANLSAARDDSVRRIVHAVGQIQGKDIDLGGYVVENALLLSVEPSAPIIVDGISLMEQVSVRFDSQNYN